MKLTETELNYVLVECIKQIINEDDTNNTTKQNQGAGTFDDDYFKNIKGRFNNRPSLSPTDDSHGVERDNNGEITNIATGTDSREGGSNWKSNAKKIGGTALGAAGGYVAIATVANALTHVMGDSFATGLGWGAVGLLGASLCYSLVRNFVALNKFKQLKLPVIAGNIPKYASLAATEKAKAQKICQELKQRLTMSITAYNMAFQDNLSMEDLLKNHNLDNANFQVNTVDNATNKETIQDTSKKINTNIDFTDINAGKNENKQRGKLLENNTQLQELVNKLYNLGEDGAKEQLKTSAELFNKAYSNWMQWVKYIQALAKKFPNHTNWDKIIGGEYNANGNVLVNGIKNLANHYLGNTEIGKFAKGVSDHFNTGVKNRGNSETQNTQQSLILRIDNFKWAYSPNNNMLKNRSKGYTGILLSDVSNGKLYCIPDTTLTLPNNVIINTIGEYVTYNFSNNDVQGTVYDLNDVNRGVRNAKAAILLYQEATENMEKYNIQINNQPTNNQPTSNQPTNNQPVNNQPTNNQPVNNQPQQKYNPTYPKKKGSKKKKNRKR